MSKQHPMLMESMLTNRVFVVTSYKQLEGELFEAREKFDVTEQFDSLARVKQLRIMFADEFNKVESLRDKVETLKELPKRCIPLVRGDCEGDEWDDIALDLDEAIFNALAETEANHGEEG